MNVYVKKCLPIPGVAGTATATAIVQYIDPLPGYKIGINSLFFQNATGATGIYCLTSRGKTTTSAAAASGVTTIVLTSKNIGRATSTDAVAAITTGDYVCMLLDNGLYQFNTVASMATSVTLDLTDALEDTIAAGNQVWGFGIATDEGQPRYMMTSSQSLQDTESMPFMWAENRGDPMILYYLQSDTTLAFADLYGGSVMYCKA